MENLPQNGKYYWINNNEFVLKSHNGTNQKRYLDINLAKWSNETNQGSPVCKSHSEIDQYFHSTHVVLLLKNNYFDFNNFESPVNQFFQREEIPVRNDSYTFINLNAKKNDFVLRDSLSQFAQQENTFYSFTDK